jgi:hypothetical protein
VGAAGQSRAQVKLTGNLAASGGCGWSAHNGKISGEYRPITVISADRLRDYTEGM